MPRARRICFPGALYHIYQRGNNKQSIFNDDVDRWHMLKLILEAKRQYGFLVHCYALMNNHFHFTIETPDDNPISKIMQSTQASYTIYFNNRHGRKGHLFQGRFNGILVEKDNYLLELSRYVHLNPVRAGYVSVPDDYRWSSYRIYIGDQKDILVDTDALLNYFDSKNKQRAQFEYRNFVESAISSSRMEEDWLKENIFRHRYLGSRNFIRNLHKRCQTCISKEPDLCHEGV